MFIEQLFKDPLYFSSTVLIVLISVILHELAHGWAAISQGDDTPKASGHMTIDPIMHMGWLGIIFLMLFGICWGAMPVNPSRFRQPKLGRILVSLAGPMMNLALGSLFIIFNIILMLWIGQNEPTAIQSNLNLVFSLGAILNFFLLLFNLLPVPPLDGFGALSEALPFLKPLGSNPGLAFVFLIILFNIPGFIQAIFKLAALMNQLIKNQILQIFL